MAMYRFNDPELGENIDHLESNLIAYETGLVKGQDDTPMVQYIFRYAHNLKSSLGMLGFGEASGLLHKVESCFDLVRNAKKRATPELAKTSLLVLDLVRDNLQAAEGTPLADSTAIQAVLANFIASESGASAGDMSVDLPFALTLAQAETAVRAVQAGSQLWVIDKLITTNISEAFFGILPVFEQAQSLGEVLDYQPHWDKLPKDRSECVLRVLLASTLDQAAFSTKIHDSFRIVRPPQAARVYLPAELPPEYPPVLDRLSFKPVVEMPVGGPAITVIGMGGASLSGLDGRRKAGCLVLAAGDFTTGTATKMASLDAGADALATDVLELEQEIRWLERLLYTGMGGA